MSQLFPGIESFIPGAALAALSSFIETFATAIGLSGLPYAIVYAILIVILLTVLAGILGDKM